eukprot:7193533-Pyramimonas_sp.AAC.1
MRARPLRRTGGETDLTIWYPWLCRGGPQALATLDKGAKRPADDSQGPAESEKTTRWADLAEDMDQDVDQAENAQG